MSVRNRPRSRQKKHGLPIFILCSPSPIPTHTKARLVSNDHSQYKNGVFITTDNLKIMSFFHFQLYWQGDSNKGKGTQHNIYRNFSEVELIPDVFLIRHVRH